MHVGTTVKTGKRLSAVFIAVAGLAIWQSLFAAIFNLPEDEADVVGSLMVVTAAEGEMLVDLARTYDLGQDELLLANPAQSRWIPVSGQQVLLPTRYVLPQTTRSGVVINLPERRLYWYVNERAGNRKRVVTFPVSVGQLDWSTPVTATRVISRKENPPWYPPPSIREEAAERGIVLPDVVAAGPANPLGNHALYLDLPGYLIHGTNNPSGIGLRVTHGCIRLYPEDVEFLYRFLPESSSVTIVDQSVKVGWQAGLLYIEVHPPLEERNMSEDDQLVIAMDLIRDALAERSHTRLQSWLVRRAVQRRNGIPVSVTKNPVDVNW